MEFTDDLLEEIEKRIVMKQDLPLLTTACDFWALQRMSGRDGQLTNGRLQCIMGA